LIEDTRVEFEIEFRVEDGPADLELTVCGVPTLEGLELLNARLIADPRFRAGLTILVDLCGVDSTGLSHDAVQILSAPMVVRDWEYAPAAVAIIAPDERTYNDLRAYRAHLGGSKSNRHIFSGRPEALAWLEEQNR
jgi:hypothetical protein